MKFIRIKSYYQNGKFTSCEQLYADDNQVKAIERFRKEYPEHKDCVVVAEHYTPKENDEYFEICLKCGCVNY